MMNRIIRGLMLVLFIGSAYSMEVAKTLNLNVVKKLLYEQTILFDLFHLIRYEEQFILACRWVLVMMFLVF